MAAVVTYFQLLYNVPLFASRTQDILSQDSWYPNFLYQHNLAWSLEHSGLLMKDDGRTTVG